MPGSLNISAGAMTITKDGRLVLDTEQPLVALVPSARIELTNYAISWPDLYRGTIYHQMRQTDPFFPIDSYGCASFVGLVEQEWGPSAANVLADTTLGTVPAGTDYLDVLVKLTNTQVPGGWFDLAMQSPFPAGEWCKLEGGSCLIEGFYGFVRMFEIILDGTTVKLRRRQSVTANGQVTRSYDFSALGNASGFIAGSAPTSGGLATYGALIQTKGPDGGNNHRPPGAPISQDPCALGGPSYASTWTGDLIITPGRVGA